MQNNIKNISEYFTYYECQKKIFKRIYKLPTDRRILKDTVEILEKDLSFKYIKCLYPSFLFLCVFFIIATVIDGFIYRIYYMIPVLLLMAYCCIELLLVINFCVEKSMVRKIKEKVEKETKHVMSIRPNFEGCGCCFFGIGSFRRLLGITVLVDKEYKDNVDSYLASKFEKFKDSSTPGHFQSQETDFLEGNTNPDQQTEDLEESENENRNKHQNVQSEDYFLTLDEETLEYKDDQAKQVRKLNDQDIVVSKQTK